jgi:hypothetical protein
VSIDKQLMVAGTLDTSGIGGGPHAHLVGVSHAFGAPIVELPEPEVGVEILNEEGDVIGRTDGRLTDEEHAGVLAQLPPAMPGFEDVTGDEDEGPEPSAMDLWDSIPEGVEGAADVLEGSEAEPEVQVVAEPVEEPAKPAVRRPAAKRAQTKKAATAAED